MIMQRLPLRPRRLGSLDPLARTGRCISYDKAELSKGALGTKVEAGLDDGRNSNGLAIDNESQTISTATGDLPMSPLFNANWMKARRRQRKDNPGKPTGRFRKKLANNPYAQALASPIRRCPNTATSIPRYFLQDFELVRHPSDDSLWWAPGPLSFGGLRTANTSCNTSFPTFPNSTPRHRSPITVYALSRKSILDKIGGPNRKYAALLSAMRTGMAVAPSVRNAVWRQDMSEVLLTLMRRYIVDALIAMSTEEKSRDHQSIRPSQWDEVKDVQRRVCVLWLPEEHRSSSPLATMKIDGAKYDQTITVHDLHWLLGKSEVERLKNESAMFKDHSVLVLQQQKNTTTTGLHLFLWRLQGYLAPPQSSIESNAS